MAKSDISHCTGPRQARLFGLDVVRATAVLLVFGSHFAGMSRHWFGLTAAKSLDRAGTVGVSLFFVLSGYLIGGILIDLAGRKPAFAVWQRFMARRWLRTLPLYFVWLFLSAAVWEILFWPPGGSAMLQHLIRFGSFTQNLLSPPADGFFGVSWSLSVEEWFYLIFSACALGIAPLAGRRIALLVPLAGFLILPAAARALWLGADVNAHAAIFWPDGIAFGVGTAMLLQGRSLSRPLATGLARVGIIISVRVWSGSFVDLPVLPPAVIRYMSHDILAIGFCLLIPGALRLPRPAWLVGWLVEKLSVVSYSLYIVHLTILELVDYLFHSSDAPTKIALSLGLIALATITLHFGIERPFMARRPAEPAPGALAVTNA